VLLSELNLFIDLLSKTGVRLGDEMRVIDSQYSIVLLVSIQFSEVSVGDLLILHVLREFLFKLIQRVLGFRSKLSIELRELS
jgi:hypothetical protein